MQTFLETSNTFEEGVAIETFEEHIVLLRALEHLSHAADRPLVSLWLQVEAGTSTDVGTWFDAKYEAMRARLLGGIANITDGENPGLKFRDKDKGLIDFALMQLAEADETEGHYGQYAPLARLVIANTTESIFGRPKLLQEADIAAG